MAARRHTPPDFDIGDIPWDTIFRVLPVVVVVVVVAFFGMKCYYTVAEYEEAVVLRFGEYHATEPPGLHFKIPLVDEAVLVNTAEHSMRLPFGPATLDQELGLGMRRSSDPDESLILTGDLYAAVVEWNVIWRVTDPKAFLLSIHQIHIENTITAVARSVMHRIVGDYSADEVLTGKREEISLAAFKETQAVLDTYECGVEIVELQMQRVIPPERVKPAFDEVNASIQEKDQLVNEANRERNALIPQAEATRDKSIREAEGYAAKRQAEAQGEIAALRDKYKEYKAAPEITRQRLYLEAMEEILASSGPKTILDADLKSLLPLLQLDAGEVSEAPGSRKGATR